MMTKVVFKVLHKSSGELNSTDYKSFDSHDIRAKFQVLNSIQAIMSAELDSECVFQVETFKEHEVTELDLF